MASRDFLLSCFLSCAPGLTSKTYFFPVGLKEWKITNMHPVLTIMLNNIKRTLILRLKTSKDYKIVNIVCKRTFSLSKKIRTSHKKRLYSPVLLAPGFTSKATWDLLKDAWTGFAWTAVLRRMPSAASKLPSRACVWRKSG